MTLSLVQKQNLEETFGGRERESLKNSNFPKGDPDNYSIADLCRMRLILALFPPKAKAKLTQLENIFLNPSLAKDRVNNGTEDY